MKILEPDDMMQNRLPQFPSPLEQQAQGKRKRWCGVRVSVQVRVLFHPSEPPPKTNFNHVRSRSTLLGRKEKGKKEIKKQRTKMMMEPPTNQGHIHEPPPTFAFAVF